jgi:NAD(P)-dependent dehydrogenase (short-subunit alcohol dehydrogenase family)
MGRLEQGMMGEMSIRFEGKVALVTGGANGIGAAVARRVAAGGARVVIADVDHDGGAALADEIDGLFVPCDVSDPADSDTAVAVACERLGGLDIVHLNVGISTGCGIGPDFDTARYRRAMGVNLDGVVFGLHAAIPALVERGGGDVVVTASLAGLVGMPVDPIYTANKHAVVGLVRSIGQSFLADGVRVNALCPGFTDTAILGELREQLVEDGMPIIAVEDVVDAFEAILAAERSGECWYVQVGRPSEPFVFRNVPGPRAEV